MPVKNTSREFVNCLGCKHAHLMQWFDNPIVAECEVRHERMVAEAKMYCSSFAPSGVRDRRLLEIEHFDHYDSSQLKKF